MQGAWMFEVTLGTAGIQQLGWATRECPFNNEEGVGDAPDSYAWDGKRVQRWNVSNAPYGRRAAFHRHDEHPQETSRKGSGTPPAVHSWGNWHAISAIHLSTQ